MVKAQRKTRPPERGPGYDGAVMVESRVQITASRYEVRPIRCRPGSFEWSYGARKGNESLYHAGVHFSGLWERANVTVQSPNLASAGATAWRGLPDNRADALSEIGDLGRDIGTYSMSRLVDYCILGTTVDEIGHKHDIDARSMAAVLKADLLSVARHFRFLS